MNCSGFRVRAAMWPEVNFCTKSPKKGGSAADRRMGDQEQMGDADALGLRRGDPAWGLFAVGAGPRWLEPLIRRYWRAGRRPDVTRFNCIGTI